MRPHLLRFFVAAVVPVAIAHTAIGRDDPTLKQVLAEAEAVCAELEGAEEFLSEAQVAMFALASAHNHLGDVPRAIELANRCGGDPVMNLLVTHSEQTRITGKVFPLPDDVTPLQEANHRVTCARNLAERGDFVNALSQVAQLPQSEFRAGNAFNAYQYVAKKQIEAGENVNARTTLRLAAREVGKNDDRAERLSSLYRTQGDTYVELGAPKNALAAYEGAIRWTRRENDNPLGEAIGTLGKRVVNIQKRAAPLAALAMQMAKAQRERR